MQEMVSDLMSVSCFEHKLLGIVRTLEEGPGVAGLVGGWEEGQEGEGWVGVWEAEMEAVGSVGG